MQAAVMMAAMPDALLGGALMLATLNMSEVGAKLV